MNPLLDLGLEPAFDQIQAEHVVPAIDELLGRAQASIDAIAEAEPRTYEAILLTLDRATDALDRAVSVVRHLEGVRTTPEFRAAHNEVEPRVSAFYSSIPLNSELWAAVKSVQAAPAGVHARFLKKTVEGFKRSGADLSPDGKVRLNEIDVELAALTTKFGENVLDSTNSWELILTDEAQLAGLPESARVAARHNAIAKGREGWRLTLQGPSYLAVMTYLDDRAIREELFRAQNLRATEPGRDNREVLPRIIQLRREKANLLGFANFADFVLEDRMAKNGKRALEFLLGLEEKSRARFEAENSALEHFAEQEIAPWDVAYWAEKQRQKLYDFDEEALRPYFSLDSVVQGMFRIYERLFGISIARRIGAKGWDPVVECFDVRSGDGRLCGIFYSDWFPRDNKRGGAWMDCLSSGGPDSGDGFDPHVGLICGNLTPPAGDQPALLTHREVETIFHEFGHLLHQLMSTVEVRSLSGTRVAWDFVELPSQIMENWCWEREALDEFARHHQTGQRIPEELFDRMKRARTFRAASTQMRQLSFGITDLKIHVEYDSARDGDVISYARSLLERFAVAPLPEDYAMIASFTHLFADPVGYGAGYYSYKWAEVLDADAFSRFRREGIFNADTGADFRDKILSRGDSGDPAELYHSFMGRDPDPSALLERQGLL